jgi:hypothetical protein
MSSANRRPIAISATEATRILFAAENLSYTGYWIPTAGQVGRLDRLVSMFDQCVGKKLPSHVSIDPALDSYDITPSDIRTAASKLLQYVKTVGPRHLNDCEYCRFLGRFGDHDLYFCPIGENGTLLARYGTDGDYTSVSVDTYRASGMRAQATIQEAYVRAVREGFAY